MEGRETLHSPLNSAKRRLQRRGGRRRWGVGPNGVFLGSTVLWPPWRELSGDPEVHAHCERCVASDFTSLCLCFLIWSLGMIIVPSSLGCGRQIVWWLHANHLECLEQSKCSVNGNFYGWPYYKRRHLQPELFHEWSLTSPARLISLSPNYLWHWWLVYPRLVFSVCCLLGATSCLMCVHPISLAGLSTPWSQGLWFSTFVVSLIPHRPGAIRMLIGYLDGCCLGGWMFDGWLFD